MQTPVTFSLVALSLLALTGLVGCASQPSSARYGAGGPRTLAVDDRVTRPAAMTNRSVGGLRAADLRLESSVREAVIEELRRWNQFAQVAPLSAYATAGREPDLVLRLKVESYGLGREGFSGRFQPTLEIAGTLVRKSDGIQVWDGSAEVDEDDKSGVGHRMAEYQANPDLLRQDYAASARVTAISLTRDLLDR